MYGYIYLTTNSTNGKMYVGRHKSECFDSSYYGSGKIMKEALRKYGKNNFKCDILEWCETKEQLYEREKYWIKKLDAVNNPLFYNLSENGCGPLGVSEDVKERLRLSMIGDNNPSKRPEVKEKIRQSKLGEKNGMFGRHFHMSEETKEKLRQINKGRKLSQETINKISQSHKGKPSKRRRKVVINGIEYESIKQAMEKLKICTRRLYKMIEQEKTKKEGDDNV